jgi:hypothetical protein
VARKRLDKIDVSNFCQPSTCLFNPHVAQLLELDVSEGSENKRKSCCWFSIRGLVEAIVLFFDGWWRKYSTVLASFNFALDGHMTKLQSISTLDTHVRACVIDKASIKH